uniref:Uncharacterized protein n=1 Tax=Caenorhabditis japonica TaxID=281687 RepID=A0A8R1E1A5_CAEJA
MREKRDAEITTTTTTTSCADGMTADTRNIFSETIASGKTWNCSLESKSRAVIQECLLDNGGATNGTLKLSFPDTDNSNPEAILSQYKNALALASSNINSIVNVKEAIGCSYAKCDQRVDILCLYSTQTTTLPPLP